MQQQTTASSLGTNSGETTWGQKKTPSEFLTNSPRRRGEGRIGRPEVENVAIRTSHSLRDGNFGDGPEPEVSLGPLWVRPPWGTNSPWDRRSRAQELYGEVESQESLAPFGGDHTQWLKITQQPGSLKSHFLLNVRTHGATSGSSVYGKLATGLIGSDLKLYHCMSPPPICPYSGKSEWFFECCFPVRRKNQAIS